MGSVILALLRHRVVEHVPESYLMTPLLALSRHRVGQAFGLGLLFAGGRMSTVTGQSFSTVGSKLRPVLYPMGSVTGVCLVTAWLGSLLSPILWTPVLGPMIENLST